MNNNYRLEKINPKTYIKEDWKKYLSYRDEWKRINNNYFHYKSWEQLKERCTNRINEGQNIYIVWNNDKTIGDFSFDINMKDNADKRYTYFRNGLANKKLNQDFLSLLFKEFQLFDSASKFLAIQSQNGENDFIIDQYQAEIGGNTETYILNIKDSKKEKINHWLATSPSKFPEFKIQFFEDIPENLLEEYVDTFSELLGDMPANSELADSNITVEEERERQEQSKKQNRTSYKYLIFNEQNKLIAHTNVACYKKSSQKEVHQYMTGVLKDYRGRGLSKWLKAAMYKKLITDFPELEKINTETHPENHASRELSKQMGFVRTGFAKEFLVSVEKIRTF